jgi:IclR family acetate operon transcriptional repressor
VRGEEVRALERGLAILDALILQEPQTLAELARATGLPKSTVHRLLHTLALRGFVHAEGAGSFRLGRKAPWFGARTAPIQEALDGLRQATGETANFGLLVGREIEYVARSLSPQALLWGVDVGTRIPAYASAMGKAALAFHPEIHYASEELAARTPNTITDPQLLARELEKVRRDGFAFDGEEFVLGVNCIAVPVTAAGREVIGALSVAGPAVRWTRMEALLGLGPLRRAARTVSRTLGGDELEANEERV